MSLFLILLVGTVIILLGLCNIKEDFTLLPTEYKWGLHDEKKRRHKRHNKRNNDKRHHRNRNPKFHKYFPNYDKPTGNYKCYYEPGEDDKCSEFNERCPIQNHPDLSNYILKSEIPPGPNMTEYILKSQIPPTPDINLPDLSDYVSKDSLPDMSNYIEKDELNNYVEKTKLPNMSDYIHKNDIDSENEPDLSDYTKNSNLPNMGNYILKSECKKCKEEDINFGQLIPSGMQKKSKCLMKDIDSRRKINKKC